MFSRSLSVCILARDESANIGDAIRSVREVVDGILVTDTGSTDRTREIARAAGAIVDEWPWRDDFSAARNHQLEIASAAWVLILDADERLVPGSERSLRSAVESAGEKASKSCDGISSTFRSRNILRK